MEQFDLVDIDDNVIGVTDKPTAHGNQHIHRIAAVYVFDKTGKLYVQVHKSSNGLLDHSVGGHISKGEAYDVGAKREAEEELGIKQDLTQMATFFADEGDYKHMAALYTCIANDDWKFVPNDEVEEIIAMDVDEIVKQMQDTPDKFTGGFLRTMEKYLEITQGKVVRFGHLAK